MKRIAVLQSNYIPWKGVFDLINSVDEFVIYDDVQYTHQDWRNRNKIKTNNGTSWLIIPVKKAEHGLQKINDTQVVDNRWVIKHWKSIQNYYRKTPYYSLYSDILYDVYKKCLTETYLSSINYVFLQTIIKILGIKTKISWSMDYKLESKGKNERLIELCKKAGANTYFSGPAAKNYIDLSTWDKNSIDVKFISYEGYPEYPQLFGDFEHYVSIIDLLFNTGPEVKRFMLSFPIEDHNGK